MPYRVDLHTSAGDIVFHRLVELGALDAEVSPDGGVAALIPDGVRPEDVARELGVRDLAVSLAEGRDAGSVWVLRRRPARVGRLEIVPADTAAPPGALRLVDAPAFGTGLHPTTALCLQAIVDAAQDQPPQSVLDVGTGSGVLALAALVLGVPRATAIDIDSEALRIAGENARINALDERVELLSGGPEDVNGTWPLVLANVLAAPLIEMAPALVRRVAHRGALVLSGIAAGVEPDVDRAYRRLGMTRRSLRSRSGWVALELLATW